MQICTTIYYLYTDDLYRTHEAAKLLLLLPAVQAELSLGKSRLVKKAHLDPVGVQASSNAVYTQRSEAVVRSNWNSSAKQTTIEKYRRKSKDPRIPGNSLTLMYRLQIKVHGSSVQEEVALAGF